MGFVIWCSVKDWGEMAEISIAYGRVNEGNITGVVCFAVRTALGIAGSRGLFQAKGGL